MLISVILSQQKIRIDCKYGHGTLQQYEHQLKKKYNQKFIDVANKMKKKFDNKKDLPSNKENVSVNRSVALLNSVIATLL